MVAAAPVRPPAPPNTEPANTQMLCHVRVDWQLATRAGAGGGGGASPSLAPRRCSPVGSWMQPTSPRARTVETSPARERRVIPECVQQEDPIPSDASRRNEGPARGRLSTRVSPTWAPTGAAGGSPARRGETKESRSWGGVALPHGLAGVLARFRERPGPLGVEPLGGPPRAAEAPPGERRGSPRHGPRRHRLGLASGRRRPRYGDSAGPARPRRRLRIGMRAWSST